MYRCSESINCFIYVNMINQENIITFSRKVFHDRANYYYRLFMTRRIETKIYKKESL